MSDSETDRLRREVERLEAEKTEIAGEVLDQLNVRVPRTLKAEIKELVEEVDHQNGLAGFVVEALTRYRDHVRQLRDSMQPPTLFDL